MADESDDLTVQDGDVKPGEYAHVVRQLRAEWDYDTQAWQDIRDEAKIDMRFVSGDTWTESDRTARDNAQRPCLSLDELGQYVNQLINDIRQHKRAIKVTAIGSGANDQTAEFRANLIRQIEYRSNAQQAYTVAFENAVQRSYGYARIVAKYASQPKDSGGDGSGFNQELLIEPFPNPDLVTVDADILRPDGSDMKHAFVAESWKWADYRKKFPKARLRDFDATLDKQFTGTSWQTTSKIQLAEYWTIDVEERKLLLFKKVQLPTGPRDIEVFEDDLEDETQPWGVLRDTTPDDERSVDVPSVLSYLTNGYEILGKPKRWPGKSIPIACCFGKILYVDSGSGPEKVILSLVRLARDPAQLYNYYRTAEAEQVGMSTKFPYFVRRGSISEENKLKLQASLHEPVAFIEVEALGDGLPAGFVPEMPVRNPFEPAIAALEAGAEGARRAIQAAMGISPLPTSAQRKNEKSGVALQEMRNAEQQGSYHFIDSYEMFVTRMGALLDENLDTYYDTARDVTIRTKADEPQQVRINDENQHAFKPGQKEAIKLGGDHDVTLSTGPAFQSEREEAAAFADELVTNMGQVLPVVGPQVAAKLLALTIKLKNVGPLGDEMADMISPPEQADKLDPAKIQADLQKAMQMNQMLTEALQKATQERETEQVKANNAFKLEELKQRGQMDKLLKDTELEMQRLALEERKIEADLLKTRATLEQKQTEAMIDREIAQTNAQVEAAGAAEERQAVSQEADKDRAFQAEEGAASRDFQASESAASREADALTQEAE